MLTQPLESCQVIEYGKYVARKMPCHVLLPLVKNIVFMLHPRRIAVTTACG
jgi:hypothetical protein